MEIGSSRSTDRMERVREAWQGLAHPDDDFSAGKPGIFIVWELTQDARNKKGDKGGRAVRMADQAEFMGRLMFDFNREIARYLAGGTGLPAAYQRGQLANGRSGHPRRCRALELYGQRGHRQEPLFQRIAQRDQRRLANQVGPGFHVEVVHDDSPVLAAELRQVVGHPFIISEGLWVPPSLIPVRGADHRRRAELFDGP